MKKSIIYLLSGIVALASCNAVEVEPVAEGGRSASQSGKVRVSFNVSMPGASADPDSKAFSDIPNITQMYLAVFGEAGWKSEYVKAECTSYPNVNTPTPEDGSGPTPVFTYSAELSILEEDCHIHFIAFENDGVDHSTLKFGSEEEVIASMTTSGGNVAYWNYVEIPGGITYKLDSDGEIAEPKALNDNALDILRYVPLVRNFAKFTISTSRDSGFMLESAKVVNVPHDGYVAAYNKTMGGFIDNYQDHNVDELAGMGFIGSSPSTASIVHPYEDSFTMNSSMDSDGKITEYVYEHEISITDPACIIVKGTYSGQTYYYRIDLVNDNEEHYPIFRNFNYDVIISSIRALGYDNAIDAYEHGSSGDISVDVRYDDLENISNGYSQIFVQYTETVVVAPIGETPDPIELKYKFIPDIFVAEPDGVDNTKVTITAGAASTAGAAFVDDSDSWAAAIAQGNTNRDEQLYASIWIQPTAPGASIKSQELVVKGTTTVNGKDISVQRNVKIVVLNEQTMILSKIDPVAKVVGSDVEFFISLPKDLPKSMFPLNLAIESKEGTISPKAGQRLTVETGKSAFDSTKPGYKFIRVVNLEEYQGAADDPDNEGYVKLTNPCRFITSVEESATEILVSNEYFKNGETRFHNGKNFSRLTPSPIRIGNSDAGSISFNMATDDPVTITVSGGSYSGTDPRMELVSAGVYTFTPTDAGDQTIEGFTATSDYGDVEVSLSAEGYATVSTTLTRWGIIPAGYFTDTPVSTSLGVTRWNNDTGTTTLVAKLHGSTKLQDITLEASIGRTGTNTEVTIIGPSGSADITRSGKNSNNWSYQYEVTINNPQEGYTYYYSTSASGNKTKVNTSFTTTAMKGISTLYLWSSPDNGTTFGYSTAVTTRFTKNGTIEDVPFTGSNKTVTMTTYSYKYTAPTSDRRVDLSGVTLTGADYFDVTYEGQNLGTIPVSALQ